MGAPQWRKFQQSMEKEPSSLCQERNKQQLYTKEWIVTASYSCAGLGCKYFKILAEFEIGRERY